MVRRVHARSYDGTSIPMWVAYKQGTEKSFPAPTLLTGYGGFASSEDPEVRSDLDLEKSTYEGPVGILSVLSEAAARVGIPTVSIWASVMAPLLSIGGLLVGLWLLASRFGLLAGTVKAGVDPSTQPWGLNTTGWILVVAPFAMFVVGTIVGKIRLTEENEDAVADLVT